MSLTSTEPRVRKALDEWRTMSRNGSFMLARMALADACVGFADAHVLMALTDTAGRDNRRALEELAKASKLLADDNARLVTDVPRTRVAAAAERLSKALEARTMLAPPKDLMEWLERPDLIPSPPTSGPPAKTSSASTTPASPSYHSGPSAYVPTPPPIAKPPRPMPPSPLSMGSMPSAASLALSRPAMPGPSPAMPAPVLGSVSTPPPMPMAALGTMGAQVIGGTTTPAATTPSAAASMSTTSPKPWVPSTSGIGTTNDSGPTARFEMPAAAPSPAPSTLDWAAPAPPSPPSPSHAPPSHARPSSASPPAASSQWDDWEQRLTAMASAGQMGEALRQAQEAVAKYPSSARLAEFLGGLHKRAGNVERAVESYVAAVEKAAKAGHIDRAERAGREAVALSRQSATTLMHVAKVASAAGIGAVALVALREAAARMAASGERPRLASVLEFLAKRMPPDAALQREADRLKRDVADAIERGQGIASDARDVAAWARTELPPPSMVGGAGGGAPQRPPTLQIVGQPAPMAGPPPLMVGAMAPRVSPPAAEPYQRASREDAQRRSRAANMTTMEPPPPPPSRGAIARPLTTVEAPNSLGYTLAGFSVLAIVLAMVTGSVIPGITGFFISQAVVSAMGAKATDQTSLKAAQFARTAFVIAVFFGMFL